MLKTHVRKKKTSIYIYVTSGRRFLKWGGGVWGWGLTLAPDIENNDKRANYKLAGEKYVTG